MFPQPLSHRRMFCAIPPCFSREDFLSGMDNRRVLRFRARSGLRGDGEKTGSLEKFPNDLWARLGPRSQIRDQGLFRGDSKTHNSSQAMSRVEPYPVFTERVS